MALESRVVSNFEEHDFRTFHAQVFHLPQILCPENYATLDVMCTYTYEWTSLCFMGDVVFCQYFDSRPLSCNTCLASTFADAIESSCVGRGLGMRLSRTMVHPSIVGLKIASHQKENRMPSSPLTDPYLVLMVKVWLTN